MTSRTANGSRALMASTALSITGVATSDSYTDVTFTDVRGVEITAIEVSAHISLHVEAKATTQAVKVKVLERASPDMDWSELQAETDVGTSAKTEVYSGNVRSGQIKIQVIEGSSSGGTLALALVAK